jgi:HEAT repeat protein
MPAMPAVAPMVWSQGMGQSFGWQSREHFDPAKETDPARRAYFEGRNFVSDSEWDKAAAKFNEVITKYSTSKMMDSALYWYAYSLKSESRYGDAYAALQRLISQYPNSRYKDDADALLVEVAGPAGQPVPPEIRQKQEEQLKLIALQSIFESKPEQGVQLAREYFKPGSTTRPEFRQKVVVLLAQVDNSAATEVLVDAARNDGDPKVRKQALVMLGQRLDDKQNGDKIFNMLTEIAMSNDAETAKFAVVSLGQSDTDRALQAIIRISGSAPLKEVRKQAIVMLSQHDAPAACEALARIYDTEKDPELQRLAIVMLAQSDCPQAVDKLSQVARSGDSVELRRFAYMYLAQRDHGKAVQVLGDAYASEKNETIKEGIIDGLGQSLEESSDKAALHKLMDIAKNDPSIRLRKKAIFWIGQSKDPEATQFLVDLLK